MNIFFSSFKKFNWFFLFFILVVFSLQPKTSKCLLTQRRGKKASNWATKSFVQKPKGPTMRMTFCIQPVVHPSCWARHCFQYHPQTHKLECQWRRQPLWPVRPLLPPESKNSDPCPNNALLNDFIVVNAVHE